MKSRAAVAFEAGKPLQIVDIDVAPPRQGEVLVKITQPGSAIPMRSRYRATIRRVSSPPYSVMRAQVLSSRSAKA